MQKITEIKENYTVNRRVIIDGVPTKKEKTFSRFREVPYVDGWPRLGHYLFDYIFILVFNMLIGAFIGAILGFTGHVQILSDPLFDLYWRILSWLAINPLFYFIFEAGMQASPAKAILGRVVVDEYGNKPTTRQVFIRSVSRAVPFEGFSCLSTLGWHDTWSKTFVIRKKDLEALKLLQKIDNIDGSSVSLQPEP